MAASFDHNKPLPALAARYASALYDLAVERDQLAMVEADLAALQAALKESAELKTFINNPLQRRTLVEKALSAILKQGKASALTQSFLSVVVMNGRANAIPVILEGFFARLAAAKGLVVADVTSARPLNDASISAIKAALLTGLGHKNVKEIALKTHVDAALLGGVRVQIGSMLYDGSLQGKLAKLGQALK